jgi:hypothetical protein
VQVAVNVSEDPVAQSGTVTKNARSTFYQRHHSGNLRFFPINWQSKGKITDAFVR